MLAHCLVKCKAICYCVIETAKLAEFIVAVIIKACIYCYLLPQYQQLIKKLVELIFILQAAGSYFVEYGFTQATIRTVQEFHGLLQSVFFTIYLYTHGAGDNAVLLCQQAHVGL